MYVRRPRGHNLVTFINKLSPLSDVITSFNLHVKFYLFIVYTHYYIEYIIIIKWRTKSFVSNVVFIPFCCRYKTDFGSCIVFKGF